MDIASIRAELERLDKTVPLEGERYACCLETYEASSSQRAGILDWVRNELLPGLNRDHLSMLSIGCAAGELDTHILAAAAERAGTVEYVGIEPDALQCERFIERLAPDANGRIRVSAYNLCFEDFSASDSYDLVMMVHSLYYMADPAAAIEKALGLVKPGGRLVVLLASEDTLNELASSFWKMEEGLAAWYGEDLSAYLQERGLVYERRRIEAVLDLTECHEPGSERGAHILDFLTQVATGQLPPQLREMILQYLDATSHRDGGKRWLPHNVDAFVITA